MSLARELALAVKQNDTRKVHDVLKSGASPDTLYNEGTGLSVLMRSIILSNEDMCRNIVTAGANVNQLDCNNESALFYAVRSKNRRIVEMIVDAGGATNQKSLESYTPIVFALVERDVEIFEYLLKRGAHLNPFTPDDSVPYSLVISNAVLDEDLSYFVKIFRANGLDINSQDYKGWTALMKAVKRGMKQTVNCLLEHGANPLLKADDGNHCILEAACKDDSEVLVWLLKANGDVNSAHSSGFTPLAASCKFGYLNNVQILLAHGANVNHADKDGLTALMYAATSNSEIVKLLLRMGADSSVTDKAGKKAIDYAKEFHNNDAVAVLES